MSDGDCRESENHVSTSYAPILVLRGSSRSLYCLAYRMALATRPRSPLLPLPHPPPRYHARRGGAYQGDDPYVLHGTDPAGCENTRRFTTGYITYFCGSPISWCSRRQRTTASSTMETEYIAASEATREVVWLRSLLTEIYLPQSGPSKILIDNQAAISLSKNPLSHAESKHIDIRYHVIRERVKSGEIQVAYVPTAQQRADVFTKALGGSRHGAALRALRLRAVENGMKIEDSSAEESGEN